MVAQPNINQFKLTTVQGQLDLEFQGSVISCQVASTQADALVAGQAVKLSTIAGGVPKVVSLADNTESTFGFVVRNLKDQDFPANAAVEIAMQSSIMYMTASAAITRGAKVEVVNASTKVKTNAGVNPVAGFALDTALVDGDLIRVYALTPGYELAQTIADIAGLQAALDALTAASSGSAQILTVTATLAELNAGKVLIPAVAGKSINVTNYTARVVGAFTTGTNIILESTNGAPVVVSTIAEAALTSGAVNLPSTANNALGAGFATALGVGDGLKVVSTGTQAGGTNIAFTFTYKQA